MKKQLLATLLGLTMASTATAQSVTVASPGSGLTADFVSINAALNAQSGTASDGVPNVITILDEGPHYENGRLIINVPRTGTDDYIIQGAEGVRPIVICDLENGATSEMVFIRAQGNKTIKDLILIPPSQGVVDEASYLAKVGQAGIQLYVDSEAATSYTLQNILITSNDGNDRPLASLDGLTPPVWTENTISFRDEGIYVPSMPLVTEPDSPHYIYMEDVVVSGLSGPDGSDGIRGFPDGQPGSKWILGPGVTVSYNKTQDDTVTSVTGNAAFQPGGTRDFSVELRGTQDNPIRFINNNANGIHVTYDTNVPPNPDDTITHMEWVIIANNNGAGIRNQERETNTVFQNVTIANNAGGIYWGAPGLDNVTYDFSNVIFAGNGNAADPFNIIDMLPHGLVPGAQSTVNISDSAVVLNGPYTAATSGTGIEAGANITLTTTNINNGDPQFLSLDPTSPDFAVVSNADYGTAGPGGQALVGGGTFQTSTVNDWQLF